MSIRGFHGSGAIRANCSAESCGWPWHLWLLLWWWAAAWGPIDTDWGGQHLQILPNSSPKDLDGFRFRFRITPQIELERDMCEWMVGHDLSMFDIKKGQMFCFVCYSCPMVEAMPIAHSYPEAWSRRNSDVAQPRAMAFVSHVSPGGNYVTMSDCDTRGSNFFRTFSSTKIYGFLRGKGW